MTCRSRSGLWPRRLSHRLAWPFAAVPCTQNNAMPLDWNTRNPNVQKYGTRRFLQKKTRLDFVLGHFHHSYDERSRRASGCRTDHPAETGAQRDLELHTAGLFWMCTGSQLMLFFLGERPVFSCNRRVFALSSQIIL